MSYWKDRMAKAQDALTDKNRKQLEKQLQKYYGKSMERVINDFERTYNKILLAVEDGKDPTPADLYKLDTYWKMQGQLKIELEKLGNKQLSAMSKIFELNFFDVYYSIALETDDSFGEIDAEIANQVINSIWVADGKSWSQRVWDNTNKLQQALNDNLIECVVTGKKTSELKKLLQEQFNVSYNRADSLVRTEMAHIQTQAAQKRYEDAGIKQVQMWAPKDERRCPECSKLHKKLYPVHGVMPVPVHPNCRCVMLPVIE